ncbi:hypothetical protein HA402_005513 [Bradysia odoriphaga]|nr:hypothetical protein HA402_005513 [Bradysia odoriphaga]
MVLRISVASIPYRKQFISANKHADETLKNWYDRLKDLAVSCDYGMHSEAFILNQFICGLDALILEYLRTEQTDLSVNDVFDLTKSIEPVDVDQVLVSIKSEEVYLSDDEQHYNDNTFSGEDDEQGTSNEVNNARPTDTQTEENGVNSSAREDIQVMVPLTAERARKSTPSLQSFECYFCHKIFKTAGRLTYHFTCYHSFRKPSKSTVKHIVKRKVKCKAKRTIDLQPPEPPKSYECYMCHKTMKLAGHLVYHYKLYHTTGKISTCPSCGKYISDYSNMVRHLNWHLDEHYHRCDMCDAGFRTPKQLEQHSISHNDPNVKKFKCKKCPKVFVQKIHLKKHVEEHKRPPLSLSEKLDSLINKKREKTAKDGKFKCDICAAQFDKESELTVHTKVHDENKLLCHLCGAKLMNKRNLMVHYRVHTGKPFKCDECGRTFSTKTKLNRHARDHAGTLPRPHKCTICGRAFIQKRHLSDHMRTHGEPKVHAPHRFHCDQCPKNFFIEDQLTRHKLVHVGITKPWNCNFCEKSFKTNFLRVEHERMHTGEKPYSCQICSKRFAKQAYLRGHRKVHLKPPRPTGGRSKKKTTQKVDNSIKRGSGEATDK